MSAYGPDFICIGAAKAGTTWLWENLDQHPDFWVPPIKELHWFDVQHPPFEIGGRSGYKHRTGLMRYAPLFRRPTWQTARWLLRFYAALDRGGDYSRFFDPNPGALSGDITPAYAILDREIVSQIHTSVPGDTRIVFIMREPVDRLWSGLRMHCRHRHLRISSFADDQLDELSQQPEHALRSNYQRTLDSWAVFGDRLGTFFFEDLRDNPAKFLQSILTFLGADSNWQSKLLNHVSNSGESSSGPPQNLLLRWRARYAATVIGVRERVGRVPQAWEKLIQAP